jgi:hypothetical protein
MQPNDETLIRVFCPHEPSWNPEISAYDRLAPNSLPSLPMCAGGKGITVEAFGQRLASSENYQVGITQVKAGDVIRTIRPGRLEHCQTFDDGGFVIDVRVTDELAAVARGYVARRGMGASLGIKHVHGTFRRLAVPSVGGFADVYTFRAPGCKASP